MSFNCQAQKDSAIYQRIDLAAYNVNKFTKVHGVGVFMSMGGSFITVLGLAASKNGKINSSVYAGGVIAVAGWIIQESSYSYLNKVGVALKGDALTYTIPQKKRHNHN